MKSIVYIVLATIGAGAVLSLAPLVAPADTPSWCIFGTAGAVWAAAVAFALYQNRSATPALAASDQGKTAAPKPVAKVAAKSAAGQPTAASTAATAAPLPPPKPVAPPRDTTPHLEVKTDPKPDGSVVLTVDAYGYNGGKYHDFILRDLRNPKIVPGVKWLERDKQKKFRMRGTVAQAGLQAALDGIAKIT